MDVNYIVQHQFLEYTLFIYKIKLIVVAKLESNKYNFSKKT